MDAAVAAASRTPTSAQDQSTWVVCVCVCVVGGGYKWILAPLGGTHHTQREGRAGVVAPACFWQQGVAARDFPLLPQTV